MAKLYWNYIKSGTRTFSSVPEKYKTDVKELAVADLVSGVISAEKYQEIFGDEVPS